jgi:hypothetical protein
VFFRSLLSRAPTLLATRNVFFRSLFSRALSKRWLIQRSLSAARGQRPAAATAAARRQMPPRRLEAGGGGVALRVETWLDGSWARQKGCETHLTANRTRDAHSECDPPYEQSWLRFEVSHPFARKRRKDGARNYFGLFISGRNKPTRNGLLLSAQNTLLKKINDMGVLPRCFFC